MTSSLCLFGAPPDTGNLGVSALGESTLHSVAEHLPGAQVLVFDNGRGRRNGPATSGVTHKRDGAWNSRRLYRSESLWTMRASSHLGFPPNRNVASIRRAAAVLDISGGDSFTDMYGTARWNLVALPKIISLRVGTPLLLLPQTYGPFANARHRAEASSIVERAQCAWSRDLDGYAVLQDLLGDRFDPARHREGVDVAFALSTSPPAGPIAKDCLRSGPDEVVVGLNVSGLIMNNCENAARQFGIAIDYPRVVLELSRRLLDDVADRLVLVPHVGGTTSESDDAACQAVAEALAMPDRVSILPAGLNASETKWYVSQLDWFCGTRMHSTIASLSTGVPAAAIAYSLKTQGVFETCGMGHAVVDARSSSNHDVVDRIIELAARRSDERARLQLRVDGVVRRASDQFAAILQTVSSPESSQS